MSPKKKLPPITSAPKDDLIDALFDSESKGEASSETVSRLSSPIHRSPPPPPSADDSDRIYNFDDPTRTLSLVRDVPEAEPTFEISNASAKLELEDTKPIANVAEASNSQTGSKPQLTRLGQNPNDVTSSAAKPKLQRLEDVLRRLRPQKPASKSESKPAPLYDSETAHAVLEAAKAKQADPMVSVLPPPVAPVGVVVKPDAPERAPTEPVRSGDDVRPTDSADEKTIAVAHGGQAQSAFPHEHPAHAEPAPLPVWADAKTEVMSRLSKADDPEADPEGEQFMPTEIRPNSPGVRFREEVRQAQPGAAIFSSAEAALRQSENLRIAQKRISDLENELERVRRENESLRSAGDTLRRRMDELQANAEAAEINTQETKKIAEEERKVLKGQIQSRDREIAEMKGRIDDAENRLESNFRKIRVRERDLEHRIEIIKAESQSITASKDRMILELKRQIDQLSSELNHSKAQVQETFGQFKEKQETARRAVRALRIALTVLEGEEESGSRKSS